MQLIRVLIELQEGMESGQLPDSWEWIEVMEPISWLLVCLEREAEIDLLELRKSMESGKLRNLSDCIEVMAPISWLLPCLEREAEIMKGT